MRSFTFEPLCETDEKNEKHFSEVEIRQVVSETRRRILEVFHYLADREIAFLLKTNSAQVKAVTKNGELPSTELLLNIHRITGVSMDWLLTGEGAKYKNTMKLGRRGKKSISSRFTFHRRKLSVINEE